MNNFHDFDNLSNSGNFTHPEPEIKPKKKGIVLTKTKFFLCLLLVFALSFGGAFGGMALYSHLNPAGTASVKNNNDDGFDINKITGSKMTVDEIAEVNLQNVVEIRTESVERDFWMQQYITEGAGSGVIIKDNGYIITNNHVIEDAAEIVVTLSNKKEYDAKIVGTDPENDIAIIKINAKDLPAAVYGDSSQLEVGDLAVVIGNPLGELGGTVTAGIISCLDREVIIDNTTMTLLQTDASVNPGNSGGGMFDQYGKLIGIIVAKSSGSDVEGLGFAIPVSKASEIAEKIIKEGKSIASKTPYSGMTYAMEIDGVYIHEVTESFAKKAGFKDGDKVLVIDNTNISSLEDVEKAITSHKPGDKVKFLVLRNNKVKEITITLQSRNE